LAFASAAIIESRRSFGMYEMSTSFRFRVAAWSRADSSVMLIEAV